MSSGFPFGGQNKPNETPQFGQPSFGQFQFAGAPTSTATTAPQFSTTFAAKPTPTSPPFSFGTSFSLTSPSTQTTAAAAPSFGFSTSTPSYSFAGSTPGLFSKPTTAPSTLFQMPTSAAAPTTASGFSVGGTALPFSSAPRSGLFASTSTGVLPTSLNFPTSPTQTMSGTTFGTPLSSMPKMTFGTSTGLSFTSTPSTTSAGLSYGLTSTASPSKLPFGQSMTSTPLNFATSQISTTSTPLNFSIPKSTQQTGLSFAPTTSFGKPQTQNIGLNFSSAPAPGSTFGTPAATTQTSLSFGTSTSTPLGFPLQPASTAPAPLAATFATPAASVPAPLPSSVTTAALTFGTTSQTSVATAAAAPTLSFSATAPSTGASTTTTASSVSFGTPIVPSTAASTGLSFGLAGVSATKSTTATTPSTFGLGGQQPPSTPARTVGLGGISSTPPKLTTPATTAQAQIAPKDQPLPNELLQTVEQFKKFVQEQKNFSSEIARCSIKELRRVEADVDLVNNCITELENEMRKNKAMAEKIKFDTAKGLQNAEMAQRTFDTPAGLQYENTAPFEYFIELSENFEKEMNELKLRIESVNKHVKNSMNPTKLNSQDLALGMRRLHETFVALAGQLQSVHNQVELQKEQYLNLRKVMLNDYTNVFETQSKEAKGLETILSNLAKQQPHANSSPTPFSLLRSSQVQTVAQNASTSLPGTSAIGAPGLYMQTTTTMPLFGGGLTSTPSFFNTTASNNAFQLQKPPVGSKRGKP